MAVCANCEHPVDSHCLDGCDYSGQGRDSCTCPFEYNRFTKSFKEVPVSPNLAKKCRCCGHTYNWHATADPGAKCTACASCDGFLDENVEYAETCGAWHENAKQWRCRRKAGHDEAHAFDENRWLDSFAVHPCPSRYRKVSGAEVACIKPTGHDGKHAGYYDRRDQNPSHWSEEHSVGYEDAVANPDRVKAADGQAGGSHYLEMPIQPWEIIDAFGLGYYEGSILSYLLRAGRKGSKLEDLKKAQHFLDKLIEKEES